MANLLLVSGLDPSGGAGFLADARVAERHGLRAIGAISALTVQTSEGVRAVEPISAELVGAQLTALLGDSEIAAGKIGMLGHESVAEAVAEALHLTAAPIVWDPILTASAGRVSLYRGDARRALSLLRDHLAVMTPNLAEASALTGLDVRDIAGMRRAAQVLSDLGPACLIKGGHLVDDAGLVDVLAVGGSIVEIAGARIAGGTEVHGTGCALATALACRLACGEALATAAAEAAAFVRTRLAAPARSGRGKPSVM